MSGLVLPDYEGACLNNLLPNVATRLLGGTSVLDVPWAVRYVTLLIDSLGWFPVAEHSHDSDLFAPGLGRAMRLTCAVPSTIATSLTSIGCGSAPGSHGTVGYSFLDLDRRCMVNALTWAGGPVDVEGFACEPTFYQRMRSRGITSGCVSLARFKGSGFRGLTFGGAEHLEVKTEGNHRAFIGLVTKILRDREVVYAYERGLDHNGHTHGVGSWQWLDSPIRAEELITDLVEALPEDTYLLVMGDHSMVDVPKQYQITIEDHSGLMGAWRVGGRPRFRQLYGQRSERLAKAWASELEERAEVWLRDDAIEAGWFGDAADRVHSRIDDVLVVMQGDWAVHTRNLPKEFGPHGQHDSLTAAGMYVSLFTFEPQ